MNCAKSGQADFVRVLVECGANGNTGEFQFFVNISNTFAMVINDWKRGCSSSFN